MGALIAASLDENFPARIVAVFSDKAEAAGARTRPRHSGSRRKPSRARTLPARPSTRRRWVPPSRRRARRSSRLRATCGFCPADFVRRYAGRMINIHPSLLPAFPGLATHERALAAGCRVHGCTVHFVTEGMDEGPIIEQEAVRVEHNDTPGHARRPRAGGRTPDLRAGAGDAGARRGPDDRRRAEPVQPAEPARLARRTAPPLNPIGCRAALPDGKGRT
jgi:phosphoribosylglycinamide formyltransferase-1